MPGMKIGCELRDLIFYLYQETLVPELFKTLGEESAIDFIKVFGGMRIEVPTFRKVQDLQRNIDIYESLCHVPGAETIKTLAQKYDVTPVWVREIHRKMRREYPRIKSYMDRVTGCKEVLVTTRRTPAAKKILRKAHP